MRGRAVGFVDVASRRRARRRRLRLLRDSRRPARGPTYDERVPLADGRGRPGDDRPGRDRLRLRTVPMRYRCSSRSPQCARTRTSSTSRIPRASSPRRCRTCSAIASSASATRRAGSAVAWPPRSALDPAQVQFDYVGLNHLGWLRRVLHDGRDLLPDLLADDERVATFDEAAIFGVPWLRTLGCVPNEYLYYYYYTRDAIRSILDEDATRGEFLLRQQGDFYAAAADAPQRAFELWQRTVDERSALYMAEARHGPAEPEPFPTGGYEQVALSVMTSIARNEPATIILNVRNGAALLRARRRRRGRGAGCCRRCRCACAAFVAAGPVPDRADAAGEGGRAAHHRGGRDPLSRCGAEGVRAASPCRFGICGARFAEWLCRGDSRGRLPLWGGATSQRGYPPVLDVRSYTVVLPTVWAENVEVIHCWIWYAVEDCALPEPMKPEASDT